MELAIVRCTVCEGSSQVESGALGLTVRCPRCDATFIAIEEIESVEPFTPRRSSRNPTLPQPEPRPERARRRPRRERDRNTNREPKLSPHHDHDPHREPPGSLPASVLIGLALLPFAIPILWLIAPAVVGKSPAMTIAVPTALAISASVLCLAVIYTVDWTATTRVKGVLMLVCLAYFGALSLYFLKKEMVERIKRFTGWEEKLEWQELKSGGYRVMMPGPPLEVPEKEAPIQSLVKLNCYSTSHDRPWFERYIFIVGSARLGNRAAGLKPGTKEWFELARREIETLSGRTVKGERPIDHNGFSGQEWVFQQDKSQMTRVVRLFVIRGSVYYLSVEGKRVPQNDELAQYFFGSFNVPGDED